MTRHTLAPIGIITGVEFEAAIIRKKFAAAVASGDILVDFSGPGNHARLNRIFDDQRRQGAAGFISFGVAGGLTDYLKPGTLVIPRTILNTEQNRHIPCDREWHARITEWLSPLEPLTKGILATTRDPVIEPLDKYKLHRDTGAVSVDMESAIIAAAAQAYDLPFIALRVIADPVDQSLPPSALAGMDHEGRLHIIRSIAALASAPWEFPALWRLARHSKAAQIKLGAVCTQLPALTQLQP